jgi:hypothetical protein
MVADSGPETEEPGGLGHHSGDHGKRPLRCERLAETSALIRIRKTWFS